MQRLGKVDINGQALEIFLSGSFPAFLRTLQQMLPNEALEHYEILYKDSDDDEIKVTAQEDYTIALAESKLEFIVRKKKEVAKLRFAEVKSVFDSTFQPATSIIETNVEKLSVYSSHKEEAKEIEEHKAINFEKKLAEQEHNAQSTFSALSAEMQFFEGKDSEVESKSKTCFKCNGSKVNKKGKTCGICNGTGNPPPFALSLKKSIEKSIRKELAQLVEEEVKKSIVSQMNSNLSQVCSLGETVHCSLCEKLVESNEKMYCCVTCTEFYLCAMCEEEHPHQLVRVRVGEALKMEIINESNLEKKGSQLIKLSLIHICRCRRLLTCRSRWSPYH
eukprot:TRINITY_DN1669_c0_g4_i1.p1 TRINITY_DN1669_c0_g4~~TRINITY_DN1669_c0_g4_i1.p1  ORF type:complete len:333 (+),score=81.34 TRINITY_DN1669_c0_g4_i1:74-1072(+)